MSPCDAGNAGDREEVRDGTSHAKGRGDLAEISLGAGAKGNNADHCGPPRPAGHQAGLGGGGSLVEQRQLPLFCLWEQERALGWGSPPDIVLTVSVRK